MTVFTIGFTQKTAEQFFGLLMNGGVRTVLDVRANNISQLAGFAKKPDLPFFLRALSNIDYLELKDLAPNASLLKKYRTKEMPWEAYAEQYREGLARTAVERKLESSLFENSCLLCSEHEPHFCHRRLAVEYLKEAWNLDLDVQHLV